MDLFNTYNLFVWPFSPNIMLKRYSLMNWKMLKVCLLLLYGVIGWQCHDLMHPLYYICHIFFSTLYSWDLSVLMHAAVVIFTALYFAVTWISHLVDEPLDCFQFLVIPILPWISFACPLVHIATDFWSYIAGWCSFSSLEKSWGLGWCYFPPENIFISFCQVSELSSNFRASLRTWNWSAVGVMIPFLPSLSLFLGARGSSLPVSHPTVG